MLPTPHPCPRRAVLYRRTHVRLLSAAYNAGFSHVADARRLALQMGWNPGRWFGHTERAILLLQQPRYHRRARYGYCRGSETVRYVSAIQLRYDHYVKLFAN